MKTKKVLSGFTIVEVMIVLAVGALILTIVFLAVPQLQRSSRNTQRDTDAYKVLSAVNECLSNNNGDISQCLPASGCVSTAAYQSCVLNSGPILGSGGYLDTSKLRALTTVVLNSPAANGNIDFPGDTKTATVWSANTCYNNSFTTGATNQFVVLYNKEVGGNGSTNTCLNP